MLVILLAARPRERIDAPGPATWAHVWSRDGMAVTETGVAEPGAMPRADTVVAVVSPLDLAWHRIALPKAPAARLRQALTGVLEEQLLDEAELVHLALAPQARAGELCWVAAIHKPWLEGQLAALAAAGRTVDRLVPGSAPSLAPAGAAAVQAAPIAASAWKGAAAAAPPGVQAASSAGGTAAALASTPAPMPSRGAAAQGHFFTGADAQRGSTDELWLAYADPQGAICLRTTGSLARELLPTSAALQSARWSATPAAATAAERWLGAPVHVLSEAEHALAAARSSWNLRQFDLASHSRGLRALRETGRQLRGPAWRPMRWGAGLLLALNLVAVTVWAWQQGRAVVAKRAALDSLLRLSHPKVRSVLDAPLQMRRETDLMRAAAGRVGDDDFEPLLALAAAAWPEGRAPIEQLRFEPGRIQWPAAGWTPEQTQQLRTRVEQAGGRLGSDEAQLTLSRAGREGVK